MKTNISTKYIALYSLLIIFFTQGALFFLGIDSNLPVLVFVALAFFVFLQVYLRDYVLLFIMASMSTFVILNTEVHYVLPNIIAQELPVLLLLLISFLIFISQKADFKIHFSNLEYIVLLVFAYGIFSAFVGLFNGNNGYAITIELYNYFYFFLIIPMGYIIKKQESYLLLIKFLVIIIVLISFQYILSFLIFNPFERFTTFHAGFFPLIISLLFGYLISKNKTSKKMFYPALFCFCAIVVGVFFTFTRSLWAASLISIATTFLMNHLHKKESFRFTKKHFFWLGVAGIIVIGILVLNFARSSNANIEVKSTSAEERVESLKNPLQDTSLLMRVEIGFYIIQKFISSPLIGKGLGDFVDYKFLGEGSVTYPDNSYLYFLWKGGIIGFIIIILFYWHFIKAAYFIFRKSDRFLSRIIALSIICGLIGFFFFGFFAANLIKYSKTNFLMSIFFGFILYEHNRIKSTK